MSLGFGDTSSTENLVRGAGLLRGGVARGAGRGASDRGAMGASNDVDFMCNLRWNILAHTLGCTDRVPYGLEHTSAVVEEK
jgi:hypothetical protein